MQELEDKLSKNIPLRESLINIFRLEKKQTIALIGLLILAILYTLYFAKLILAPITIALLVSFLLAPIIRVLQKLYIPRSISIVIVMLIFLGLVSYGFYSLSGPITNWIAKSPEALSTATIKISKLVQPLKLSVRKFYHVKKEIEETTKLSEEKKIEVVSEKQSHLFTSIFSNTTEFIVQLLLCILLIYFFLETGDIFLRKLVETAPHLKEKKDIVIITHEIGRKISSFLIMKILISVVLAISIYIAMLILDMPNPLLWGIIAGVLEFIPYIGVLIGTVAIALSTILVFNDPVHILLIPIIFFCISSFFGNIIAPFVFSRSLILHPIVVFLGVIFWGWIWGIPGALIAVPLISIFKIICDNINGLKPLSKFLGE